jgi:hypothetical protein
MGTEEPEPTGPVTPDPVPSATPSESVVPVTSDETPTTPSESVVPVTSDETPTTLDDEPTQSDSPVPVPKKKVVLNEHGSTAKIRNPWLVVLFVVITLGIYYLFWYYFVNREMADYGEANQIDIGHSPGMSVVAITIGAFIIVPPFVSLFHTGTRMRLTRRVAERPGGSAGLFFLLSIIPIVAIFAPAYLQSELNGAWERLPHAPV